MDSYKIDCQNVGNSLKPTLLRLEALQKGLKATIKATMVRSNKAPYKHPSRPNKVHILIYKYTVTLIFFLKTFVC